MHGAPHMLPSMQEKATEVMDRPMLQSCSEDNRGGSEGPPPPAQIEEATKPARSSPNRPCEGHEAPHRRFDFPVQFRKLLNAHGV